jgi:hypothetical protein
MFIDSPPRWRAKKKNARIDAAFMARGELIVLSIQFQQVGKVMPGL